MRCAKGWGWGWVRHVPLSPKEAKARHWGFGTGPFGYLWFMTSGFAQFQLLAQLYADEEKTNGVVQALKTDFSAGMVSHLTSTKTRGVFDPPNRQSTSPIRGNLFFGGEPRRWGPETVRRPQVFLKQVHVVFLASAICEGALPQQKNKQTTIRHGLRVDFHDWLQPR